MEGDFSGIAVQNTAGLTRYREMLFIKILQDMGIIPGIQADKGVVPLVWKWYAI